MSQINKIIIIIIIVPPGFLTIGIVSVRRPDGGGVSIHQTIESLTNRTTTKDRESTTIVVFLADLDKRFNDASMERLQKDHTEHFDSGFIRVLRVGVDAYTTLENHGRNINDDAPKRVRWRAKQVIDFALVLEQARNISEYYLQLKDDVVCAPNFVADVRGYVQAMNADAKNRNWVILEFSELGVGGKLFRSDDLVRLTRYLMTFYAEQSVDSLLSYFRLSMGQTKVLRRTPMLCRHVSAASSTMKYAAKVAYINKPQWNMVSSNSTKLKDVGSKDKKYLDSMRKPPLKSAKENFFKNRLLPNKLTPKLPPGGARGFFNRPPKLKNRRFR